MFRRRSLFTSVIGFNFLWDQSETRKSFFGKTFSEVWDQNILRWLPEKRHYSIVRIASVRYVQAVDCNTRLHETLSTW